MDEIGIVSKKKSCFDRMVIFFIFFSSSSSLLGNVPFCLLDFKDTSFCYMVFLLFFEGCEKICEKLEFLCCAPTVLGPQQQRWAWQSSIRVP